jgi:hypothetical protein
LEHARRSRSDGGLILIIGLVVGEKEGKENNQTVSQNFGIFETKHSVESVSTMVVSSKRRKVVSFNQAHGDGCNGSLIVIVGRVVGVKTGQQESLKAQKNPNRSARSMTLELWFIVSFIN